MTMRKLIFLLIATACSATTLPLYIDTEAKTVVSPDAPTTLSGYGITDAISGTPTEGAFIVGDGASWVNESGIDAQKSLGVVTASGGGTIGDSSTATTGGAVGSGAVAADGFAGGNLAVADGPGRVQLGSGTNTTDSTIQFLDSGSVTAEQFGRLARMGFVDYNDASGNVSLSSDTWTDVPNDTLGPFTNTTYIPSGVTALIDDATGYLDFTELQLGQEILIRNDFTITPNTNNALLQVRYVLGTGAGEYALLFWSERLDSGSGVVYQRVITFPIYMGDTNTRDNPGKLQVKLSTPGTLNNNGSYISIR